MSDSSTRTDSSFLKTKNAKPTRLLVSVRDCQEAAVAIDGGADLVDVKEPLHGSLGAADPQVLAAVCDRFSQTTKLSVALGELVDWKPASFELPRGFRFAKFGLAGSNGTHWKANLKSAFDSLPVGTRRVVVAYGDWEACGAPSPDEAIKAALEVDGAAVLFDTFIKNGTTLLDCISAERISGCLQKISSAGLLSVLAGSLRGESLRTAIALSPDYVAVRGAVCRPDRKGAISKHAMTKVKSQLENAELEKSEMENAGAVQEVRPNSPHECK